MINNIPHLDVSQAAIVDYCQRWKITKMELFGSVLRADFRPDSDVDVLVTFASDAHWTLFDLVDMQDELTKIMGRKVDIVERHAVEHSRNYIRRKAILGTALVIYVN